MARICKRHQQLEFGLIFINISGAGRGGGEGGGAEYSYTHQSPSENIICTPKIPVINNTLDDEN